MRHKIVVIGAGFGGAGAALALARDGHDVTVLEAVREPGPIGAGIMLQPSGMLALARWGVLGEVLAHGERCDRLRCVRRDGRLLFDLKYSVQNVGLYGLGLHRGALFSALYEKLEPSGVKVHLGVQAAELDGPWVRDTESHKHGPFDLIVVADGARSRIRAALGHSLRDDEYPWGALWFVAKDPERRYRNELLQCVHGTGLMLGLLPTGTVHGDPLPRVSLFFSVKLSELKDWRSRGIDAWKEVAVQLSPDSEPVLAQIDSFDDLLVATYRDVRLARLNYGNVAYVGDSAHAMSPQLGQCSNLALLDALALADALRDEHNIERALSVYSKARKAQLSYYGFVNRALTQFFQGDSRAFGWVRYAWMPLLSKFPLTRTLMVSTMCGIQRGFFKRSLAPMPELAKILR